ncbi:hypothetical protein QN277_016291 [Acacia crassicarpa]|uniref:MYB transcription factor n=1 Tax=Acacia crassicarpa TaxID=499986 RepID=A0AAE1MWC1_9FABA|nr:hypothetical protein QN277_016291 [Acacia crassicarpa]
MNTNNTEEAKHEGEEALGGVTGERGGGAAASEEVVLKKGPWTAAEDAVLVEYVTKHGEGNWNAVQRNTGLARCGKSCRLRWANHLRPNLKKGAFSSEEEKLILELHAQYGNKWARMASLLPGRTDNEIKNYWNTRVKRRQRQGLPLYSDEPDRSNVATPPPNNASHQFEFLHHHHYQHALPSPSPQPQYSPLSSPLQPKPAISDPMIPLSSPSSSVTSSHSFIFSRPAPLLSNPLNFKRFRTSTGFPLRVAPNTIVTSSSLPGQPMTPPPQSSIGFSRFGYTGQVNSGLSHNIYQAPLLEYDNRGGALNQFGNPPPKLLELSSNQFSPHHQPNNNIMQTESNKFNMQMNHTDDRMKNSCGGRDGGNNNGFLGDHFYEVQSLTPGHQAALKKRSYFYTDEGNDLDGHRGFDDLPLNSSNWPSNNAELKLKEEAQYMSKSMNDDISSMMDVMPSSLSVSDWPASNATEASNNNFQSSDVIIPDDNFGLDSKPIASLFPTSTTTTNHNDNSGCYSWDDLPGFC